MKDASLFKYSNEEKFKFSLSTIFVIIVFGIWFIGFFGALISSLIGPVYIPLVILAYILLIITIVIVHNKKVDKAIKRKNGILHNGIVIQGTAKRRGSEVYISFKDPSTGKDRGYLAAILLPKSQKGLTYKCDVYILDNECYATNFR